MKLVCDVVDFLAAFAEENLKPDSREQSTRASESIGS